MMRCLINFGYPGERICQLPAGHAEARGHSGPLLGSEAGAVLAELRIATAHVPPRDDDAVLASWMHKRTRILVSCFGLACMAVQMEGGAMDDRTFANEVVRRFRSAATMLEIMEPGLHNDEHAPTLPDHTHPPEEACSAHCPAWDDDAAKRDVRP